MGHARPCRMGSLLPCKPFQSEFPGGAVIRPDAISTRKSEGNDLDMILLGEGILVVCISRTSPWSSSQTGEGEKGTFFFSDVATTRRPPFGVQRWQQSAVLRMGLEFKLRPVAGRT